MGNTPSSEKKTGQGSSAGSSATGLAPNESGSRTAQPKRSSNHPMQVQNQRVAAPPEPSMAHAQGSTSLSSRPKSMPPGQYTAQQLASVAPSATKPTNIAKPRPIEGGIQGRARDMDKEGASTKPVAVPHSQPTENTNTSTSPLSPYAESVDAAALIPHSSMQDMSYLTRPPRLPLPIEEEVHTPGSPIIAPADTVPEPADGEIEQLDSGITRKSSTLSNTTVEEDETEELLVDKTRPTVPTRLEWSSGGERVYVTGTIFQWNRKQRLHPVYVGRYL